MQGTLYSIMIFPLSHGGADLAVWMLLLKHLFCAVLSALCETLCRHAG